MPFSKLSGGVSFHRFLEARDELVAEFKRQRILCRIKLDFIRKGFYCLVLRQIKERRT